LLGGNSGETNLMEKLLAVVFSVVVAFIYLTGYAYLEGFYEYFNISLGELDLDIQEVLVHAAPPYRAFFKGIPVAPILAATIIFTITVLGIFGADKFYITAKSFFPFLLSSSGMLLFTSVIAFFSFYVLWTAPALGFQNAEQEYSTLNSMEILGAPDTFDIDGFMGRVPNTSLFHLVTTESTYFGVIKNHGKAMRWIVRIPRTEGIAARIFQDKVK
jgi:hypothetical protein